MSLKACPLPLPKCEMLRLRDAGLLLFVQTRLLRQGNPAQKVSTALRTEQAVLFFSTSNNVTTNCIPK